ncbi:hypothetical protein Pan44_41160 [Caulifigura coniformis]|uniref:Uncharacterized protein n=1 Tax=Caulifigura coniformis TaxID=2527983 RepID=A0A517SIZ7_9PLAN|nr:hypothetical protein [Caulifigura coniformis]QDT56066.1 hypothetical protein Pan44_41160 [Caulifigura coniformis]
MLWRSCMFVCVCWGFVSSAYGQFEDLAGATQRDANAILAIDVAALKSSPLATERGWTKKLEAAYVDRATFLPPEASSVLVAGQLVLDREFQPASEVAVMKLLTPVSMAGLARANGGQLETLRGRDAIATTGDAYIVALGENLIGLYSPAHRQAASQWVADAGRKGGNGLSDYLKKALAGGNDKTQIVLAMELQDALSPRTIAEGLKKITLPAGGTVRPEDLAPQLETLRGLTVEIAVAKEVKATTRIDFGKTVTFSAAIAKTLLVSAMQNAGVELPEIADHRFEIRGSTVVAEGELSPGALRRLMSLLEVPNVELAAAESPPETTPSSADQMAAKSQLYFKSAVSLLDDLRGDRSKQDPRGGMDAVWMDKYAAKIDRLPSLDVDEELLVWGENTAQTLRVMASARRGRGLSAGASKSGLRTGVSWDGYYGVSASGATATQASANQIDVTQGNMATARRVEGWRLIDNATAEVRKKLTQRYRVEF